MNDQILLKCDRCSMTAQPLGRVLEYGQFYPEREVEYTDGTIKKFPAKHEILEAICSNCAKEVWDNERIASLERKVAAGEALAGAVADMRLLTEPEFVNRTPITARLHTRLIEQRDVALSAYKEATKDV